LSHVLVLISVYNFKTEYWYHQSRNRCEHS